MKTNLLGGLFEKYVSKEKLENPASLIPSIQDRMLAVVTGIGVHRFSGSVGDLASGLPDLGWSVETMHPLILASRPLDAEGVDSCKRLLGFCSSRDDLNAVIAIGAVKHGTIGSGIRFAYGSVGEVISAMVEVSALSSRAKIMLNGKLCDYLKYAPDVCEVKIGGQNFYEWAK